jgi:cytoskeletal protein RodZ
LSGEVFDYTISNNPVAASYRKAAEFGGGALFMLVASALNAVLLLGLNLIYLKLSIGLDPSETEKLMGQRLAKAREKALAIKEESQRRLEAARELRRQQQEAVAKAQAAAAQAGTQTETPANTQAPEQTTEQARIPEAPESPEATAATVSVAPAPQAPTPPPDQPAVSLCPQCQTPVTPGDLFCGECGNKLS